jgi:23S rRNA (pseudouridine1915-N3)-methyltransferase
VRIEFRLDWVASSPVKKKDFKLSAYHSLLAEYTVRISRFVPCQISGSPGEKLPPAKGIRIWACDRGKDSQSLSSEALASHLERVVGSGTKGLWILIGGPDGFSRKRLAAWDPDLTWSFGPLTFPHELASVIAAEQIYRAWTLLRGHPYHSGH